MSKQAFDSALQRVKPFLSELTDDFIVVVMDNEQKQAVSLLYGDPKKCMDLALAAQFELEKRYGVSDSESGGDPERADNG